MNKPLTFWNINSQAAAAVSGKLLTKPAAAAKVFFAYSVSQSAAFAAAVLVSAFCQKRKKERKEEASLFRVDLWLITCLACVRDVLTHSHGYIILCPDSEPFSPSLSLSPSRFSFFIFFFASSSAVLSPSFLERWLITTFDHGWHSWSWNSSISGRYSEFFSRQAELLFFVLNKVSCICVWLRSMNDNTELMRKRMDKSSSSEQM